MKSRRDTTKPVVMNLGGPARFNLANPSAKIVLALLFLVSLNAVACYDATLSVVLRLSSFCRVLAVHVILLCLSLAREICDGLGKRFH